MTTSSDSFNARTASDLRDEVEGKDDANHLYSWAVKVLDEELSRILADKKRAWEEWKDEIATTNISYEETEEFHRIVSKNTTVNATQSTKSERMEMLKYLTARAESPELKHKRLWQWLYQYLRTHGEEYITQHLSGDMGAGKTDFALFEAEIWKQNHPDGEILSNIESFEKATTITTQDELDEWLEENPDTDYFFVFDEANKHASGTGDSSAVENQLYPLVTFIRKNDGNLVIIGHNSKDIHKWVRELCDFVHKTSKKTAHFYRSVGDDGEPEDKFRTLRNIPQTRYEYDTGEVSDWSWADDKVQVCIGTNKEGERCSTPLRFDYDEEIEYFCDTHHTQDEPHPDVPAEELEDTPYDPVDGEQSDSDSPDAPEADGTEPMPSDAGTGEEADEEARASTHSEENPTSQESPETEESTRTIDDVPPDGWEIVLDKTGLTKKNLDDWEQIEEILNSREVEKLESMMS